MAKTREQQRIQRRHERYGRPSCAPSAHHSNPWLGLLLATCLIGGPCMAGTAQRSIHDNIVQHQLRHLAHLLSPTWRVFLADSRDSNRAKKDPEKLTRKSFDQWQSCMLEEQADRCPDRPK